MVDMPHRLLVISPHPDDGILGVGGTMARHTMAGGEVTVLVIAAHMPPLFTEEVHQQTIKETFRAHAMIGVKETIFLDRPALSLPRVPHEELNRDIADVLARVSPDVLLVTHPDRNIDHRAVFESTMVASRPMGAVSKLPILASYEIVGSTHWIAPHIEPSFVPNWVVDISDFLQTKIKMLLACEVQMRPAPHPRSIEVVSALARFRGSHVGVSFGEAFSVLRMTLPPHLLGRG